MIELTERMANDRKLPVQVTTWACDMYDKLSDIHGTIETRDIRILQALMADYDAGLYLLDHRLADSNLGPDLKSNLGNDLYARVEMHGTVIGQSPWSVVRRVLRGCLPEYQEYLS